MSFLGTTAVSRDGTGATQTLLRTIWCQFFAMGVAHLAQPDQKLRVTAHVRHNVLKWLFSSGSPVFPGLDICILIEIGDDRDRFDSTHRAYNCLNIHLRSPGFSSGASLDTILVPKKAIAG